MSRIPIDHARLAVLAGLLRRCPAAENKYALLDIGWKGFRGSQAEADRHYRGPAPTEFWWRERVVSTAYAAARIYLGSAGEQALAVGRLITDPEIGAFGMLGVDACARSAVELCARAFWLLDSHISPHDRVCRGLVDQLYNSYEAERLAKVMGWTKPVDELGIAPRLNKVRSTCAELGVVVTGAPSSPLVDGQQRPAATDLITALISATPYGGHSAMVYKVLSAANHGTIFGLMRGFLESDETLDGERVVDPFVDHRLIEASAGVVMMSFIVVLTRVVDLMGWDPWRAWSLSSMFHSQLARGPR